MSVNYLQCPFCGHIWEPRVINPKACPRCKRHFNQEQQPAVVSEDFIQKATRVTKLRKLQPIQQTEARLIRCSAEGCEELAMYNSETGTQCYCLKHKIEELRNMRQITNEDIFLKA